MTVASALAYAARGWPVFPCNPADKHPLTVHGFKDASRDEAQVRAWWRSFPDVMIGIPTGAASGFWALDVDVGNGKDGFASLAALEQAHDVLPPTLTSATPRGGRHLLFKWHDGIRNSASQIADGIDVRGDGGYIVVPPSVCANRNGYTWCEDCPEEPAEAPAWLLDLVSKPKRAAVPATTAAGAPLSRGNGAYARAALERECDAVARATPGQRNATLNRASFSLHQLVASGELSEVEVMDELLAAATACGLVNDDGVNTVRATIKSGAAAGLQQPRAVPERSAQPRTKPEIPAVAETDKGPRRRRRNSTDNPVTGVPSQTTGTTIRIIKGEIARMVDEAEATLIAVADTAPIMVRAGRLVQPIIDLLPASHGRMTQVALLRPLTAANLVYLLNKHAATFVKYDGRSKKWLAVDPPPAIATQLLEKGCWRFSKVAGVITTPTLRPDGTVLDRPGYDPATQLWYRPDSQLVLPRLLEDPTREQAKQALTLLTDLLVGFPFESGVYRSVALAALLTAVLRGAFDVVPMNLLRAPDVGSGKSYLADLISTIARGQICPVITNAKSVEEMEKRLGALVLEGVPMISLDNCSGDIGGDLLCQITERRLIRIRILGKSEAPECEWRGTLFATGNNITFLGDMARRGLVAKLNPKVERPELREFSFDPIERVLTDRGAYIAAAITIARAYITAGSPNVCGALGSYEPWSRMVRSPLIWLGQEDPVKSMDEAREEDPVRRAEHALIVIWRSRLGPNVGYTAAELIRKANEQTRREIDSHDYLSDWTYPQLRELLVQQAGTPRGDIDARKVGNWLTSIRGRVHDGYCVERVKESAARGNTYALLKLREENPP